jgi:hypothetical protein
MNSYRIDTYKFDNGIWKVAAFECGRYIGEAEGTKLSYALELVVELIAKDSESHD